MLSISRCRSSPGNISQYYAQERIGYYGQGMENRGLWQGSGARALNLPDAVTASAFSHLLTGHMPDGRTALVKNAGSTGRHSSWDLTFSAPKSVSTLWAVAPPEMRAQIASAHAGAVKEAVGQLERWVGVIRRGKAGKVLEPAGWVFATFQHSTSRTNDPQLHTHCVLINAGVGESGATASISTVRLFQARTSIGALYQAGLADRLKRDLGLNPVFDKVGFKLDGVPSELCRAFSQRRIAMEKALNGGGENSSLAAAHAAITTRPRKTSLPTEQLFAHWREVAMSVGWSEEKAARLCKQSGPTMRVSPEALAKEIREACNRMEPTRRDRTRVSRAALEASIRLGADADALAAAFKMVKILGFPKVKIRERRDERGQQHTRPAPEAISRNNELQNASNTVVSPVARPPHSIPRPTVEQVAGGAALQTVADPTLQQIHPGARPDGMPQQAVPRRDPVPVNGDRSSESHGTHPGDSLATGGIGNANQKSASRNHTHQRGAASIRYGRGHLKVHSLKANREFKRRLWAEWGKVHPEFQTHRRLEKLAVDLAGKTGASGAAVVENTSKIVPGNEWRGLHWRMEQLFPNSPVAAIRGWRVPRLAYGSPKSRWGRVHWRQNILIGQVRWQTKRLFPNAPRWSPFRELELPAVRFTPRWNIQKPKSSIRVGLRQDRAGRIAALAAKLNRRDPSERREGKSTGRVLHPRPLSTFQHKPKQQSLGRDRRETENVLKRDRSR